LWAQRYILGEKTAKKAFHRTNFFFTVENLEQNFFLLFIKKWYLRVIVLHFFPYFFFGLILSKKLQKLGVYHHKKYFFVKSRMKFKKRLCNYAQNHRSDKLNQLPSKYFQRILRNFGSTIENVLF
jgi:hypothetical protein